MSRPEVVSAAERDACLYFSLVQAKVGRSLMSRLGERSMSEAAELSGTGLAAVSGLSEKAAAAIENVRRDFDAEEIFEVAAGIGVRVVTLADGDYPQYLREVSDPPPALFVKGSLPTGTLVSVVGSRKASAGAHSVAREIGRALAGRGVAVVSGLALGIDAEAHRGALDAGGATVGVLGCGIDVVYPKRNRGLFEEVVESGRGAIVSEYFLGEAPLAWRFPARNRIISGLCGVTVVVEAAERSGSLITARCALDEGREVWAVPGPVGMPECRGSNRLIADGASVLWDIEEFAEAFGEAVAADDEASGAASSAVPEGLPPGEAKVLGAVGFVPGGVDEIGVRSGLSMSELLSALTMLELKGYVLRDAAGAFVRRSVG